MVIKRIEKQQERKSPSFHNGSLYPRLPSGSSYSAPSMPSDSVSFQVPSNRKRALYGVPRCSAAQRSASFRPLGTSTANQMTRPDARHIPKRNGKPFQMLPVLSMITWITFGPMTDDARFVNPNRAKNCTPLSSHRTSQRE
jgi:hypothetical protein